MSFINDLNIQISLSTLPITQQGFGLPLVTGERANTSPLCKKYAEYADLTEWWPTVLHRLTLNTRCRSDFQPVAQG
jgi:hypothetical protein